MNLGSTQKCAMIKLAGNHLLNAHNQTPNQATTKPIIALMNWRKNFYPFGWRSYGGQLITVLTVGGRSIGLRADYSCGCCCTGARLIAVLQRAALPSYRLC